MKLPILHGYIDRRLLVNFTADPAVVRPLLPAPFQPQFYQWKAVVGESRTFGKSKEFLESHGVEVVILDLNECVQMMEEFIEAEPELWNEDIMEL